MNIYRVAGIVFIIGAVALAGNWLYYPFRTTGLKDFQPIAHYPKGDPADVVYNSSMIYMPSKHMYYIDWYYVWLNASYHTPDTEIVRTYIKDGELHHIALQIHYMWMDVYEYEKTGNHVHIYFMPVYHTPYTTIPSYIELGILRILPISIILITGVFLLFYSKHRRMYYKHI